MDSGSKIIMSNPTAPHATVASASQPDSTSPSAADDREDHLDTSTVMSPEQGEVFAPPAHIAARFYKNKLNARRKSSAASSRRNSLSLSSAHSHASSHRRGTHGPQNTYIAQHLRRASIIESRRARLADRAAHVEQVRLRAALAKAAPRGNISTTEERSLAASIAKEKYLAKVAATCAEEVARAKRIAEEVKERKQAEEARVRLEMEERHAEAEKRRSEYQRNMQARRARRADSAEKKLAVVEEADADEDAVVEAKPSAVLDEDSAARQIQEFWRTTQRRRAVRAFQSLGFNLQTVKDTSFEDMTARVANAEVMASTTAILTHLRLQERNDPNAALNTRTFLSAFMVLAHPTFVLSQKNGAVEQDLMAKATELVTLFETAVARLAPWNGFSPNPMQHETLAQAYTVYTLAFAAWRLQDSSVIIEGMVASFVELDKIWQKVKDDTRGEVSNEYREGIRDSQVVLLSQIRRLAGPERADTLIKKAIRESRRARPRKRPVAEVRPRVVDPAESQDEVPAPTEDIAEPPSPVDDTADLTCNALLGQMFSVMPSNRVLTHELAINKDYKLVDPARDARAGIYQAITNRMKTAFEVGQSTPWTLAMAENIKAKLLKMTKPGTGMHTLIAEALDGDNIGRQCAQGVFSYDRFFDFMADLLPKLCAPFRDQEVGVLAADLRDREDSSLDKMVGKLLALLAMIDVLNLDYTNFMLINAAPTLIREAGGYEQRQFSRDLEAGVITLDRTRRWWQAAAQTLSQEADRRDPDRVRHPSDRPSPRQVHTHALLHLAFKAPDLDSATFPDTLRLDWERFHQLRDTALDIVVHGAILLTTKNLLKRDVRSAWKHEAKRLSLLSQFTSFSEPETADTPSAAQRAFSILETAHNMPPSTKTAVQGHISRFYAHAALAAEKKTLHFTDPVLKLLMHRLFEHLNARLAAQSDAEQVRAASSAAEKLAASGLAEYADSVKGIVEMLDAVRKADWEGHGRWYALLAEEE